MVKYFIIISSLLNLKDLTDISYLKQNLYQFINNWYGFCFVNYQHFENIVICKKA